MKILGGLRRGGQDKYVEVLNIFGPSVCRAKVWKTVRNGALISDVLSIQLEAFLIVVLENEARYQSRQYNIRTSVESGRQVPLNDITRPYTAGGEVTCNGHWNKAAMARYKTLCHAIVEDRKSSAGEGVEKDFQAKMTDRISGKTGHSSGGQNLSEGDGTTPPEDAVYSGWDAICGLGVTKKKAKTSEEVPEDDHSSLSTPRSSVYQDIPPDQQAGV